MEYLIALLLILAVGAILAWLYNFNLKRIKNETEDKELDAIVSKFPDNIEICKSILQTLNNETVKIKQNENDKDKTSLYVVLTDTIFIANIKDTYTRIQTIAHECIHSVQSKKLLFFNFIFTNLYAIYFIISIVLTLTGVFKNHFVQIIILLLMSFLQYTVRSYLETDAMIKARYVAENYMREHTKNNKICADNDINNIVNKYDQINKLGIPAYNYLIFIKSISKPIIYIIITIVLSFL